MKQCATRQSGPTLSDQQSDWFYDDHIDDDDVDDDDVDINDDDNVDDNDDNGTRWMHFKTVHVNTSWMTTADETGDNDYKCILQWTIFGAILLFYHRIILMVITTVQYWQWVLQETDT